jgi:hypothetical protein
VRKECTQGSIMGFIGRWRERERRPELVAINVHWGPAALMKINGEKGGNRRRKEGKEWRRAPLRLDDGN